MIQTFCTFDKCESELPSKVYNFRNEKVERFIRRKKKMEYVSIFSLVLNNCDYKIRHQSTKTMHGTYIIGFIMKQISFK
jgi:hypothetical protein